MTAFQYLTCTCGKKFVVDWKTEEVMDPLTGIEYPVCSLECAAQFMAMMDTREEKIQ